MDPSTISSITAEVWKVGGIVATLLVLLVVVVFIFGRFLFNLVKSLSHRLDTVQAEKTDILTSHIAKGNDVMSVLTAETREQTGLFRQLLGALKERKCLVDDTPRKTPLPGYHPPH
jgi:hypothetical protein